MINKIEFSAKYLTSNAGLFLLVERTSKNGIFDLINHDLVFENTSTPPVEIESGTIVGGFSHDQVLALADKVVASVKSGTIKHFVVMGGCDGRQGTRSYYTEIAQNLPKDTVILTARYAK